MKFIKPYLKQRKLQLDYDIHYTLYRFTLVLMTIIACVLLTFNIINKRPLVNILTSIGIIVVCSLWYYLSNDRRHYSFARISLTFIFAVVYTPFGYLTSPGSISAMPFILFMSMFFMCVVAVNNWEYVFPFIVIVLHAIMLQTELYMPEYYPKYTSPAERIHDLTLNYTAVSVTIVSIMIFVMKKYNSYSKKFHILSITDQLTGLYNKRYLEENALHELNRCSRNNTPLSLAFLDLDNFKKINDSLGHQEGDRVLADIGKILKNEIRDYDICARYGGDEFVLVLPMATEAQAHMTLERLEQKINDYTEKYKQFGLAISYGIAVNNNNDSLEELLQKADQKLYEKKRR